MLCLPFKTGFVSFGIDLVVLCVLCLQQTGETHHLLV